MKTVTLEPQEAPEIKVVVRISDVSVDSLYGVQELSRGQGGVPSTRAAFRKLAAAFEPFLVSWTLPGDANAKGLEEIDFNLALAIVNGWLQAVANAPLPLLRRSSDGDTSDDLQPSP